MGNDNPLHLRQNLDAPAVPSALPLGWKVFSGELMSILLCLQETLYWVENN